ncbi:hypothetical protein [Campylobacter upsaliensis]|nr:hypothetical protein [Campylobacter upsaliensis]
MDCSLELLFDEAENHFKTLKYYLSTSLKDFKISSQIEQKDDNWYLNKTLPNPINKPQKQAKARYFGCVAYFTRQSWDVVKNNIEHFTFERRCGFRPLWR